MLYSTKGVYLKLMVNFRIAVTAPHRQSPLDINSSVRVKEVEKNDYYLIIPSPGFLLIVKLLIFTAAFSSSTPLEFFRAAEHLSQWTRFLSRTLCPLTKILGSVTFPTRRIGLSTGHRWLSLREPQLQSHVCRLTGLFPPFPCTQSLISSSLETDLYWILGTADDSVDDIKLLFGIFQAQPEALQNL